MNINIKSTNTSLTPQIEVFLRKKLAVLEKIISPEDSSVQIYVEIGKETEHHKSGEVFFAEFNLHIAHKDFRVRRNGSDIYTAIDIAKDELFATVRTHKGKSETLLRRGSSMIKNMVRGFPWRRRK